MDSEEKAYAEGHEAGHNGYGLSANPYKRFTAEWREWKQGWNDEQQDDPYWVNLKKIQKAISCRLKKSQSEPSPKTI